MPARCTNHVKELEEIRYGFNISELAKTSSGDSGIGRISKYPYDHCRLFT